MAQTITEQINISPHGIPNIIHLSQYDKGSRILSFELYDENGAYSIPSGSTVTIRGTKPDHTGFEYSCTYSGSAVTVTVQDQMTAVAGNVPCEVRITGSDGSILGTANFTLAVERSALASDVTISKTELPLVEKACQNVQKIESLLVQTKTSETNASKSAASAATSASNAQSSEANAKSSQNAAKTSETNAATSASNAKASESNAKSSQTEAANSATAAKESETNAASSAASALDSATKAAGYAGATEYSLGINPKTGHMAIFYNRQS